MFIPVNSNDIYPFSFHYRPLTFCQLAHFKVNVIVLQKKKNYGAPSAGLRRSPTAWNMTQCATKNTEYQMEIQPFLFSFSRVFLFFYFSFTPLLSCYFVFEHDSGSDPLSDWNRCCAWIVVALFWGDCSSM